jgi:hypothetical protein
MIPLTNQILEVIKKHGAIGVLALWLGYTHFEVQDLKVRLYNCLEKESVTKDQQQPIAPIKDTAVISYESKKRKQEVLHYDAP